MAGLDDVSDLLHARRRGRRPFVVGITGAVAAGKSVFAAALALAIVKWPEAPTVEIVNTDGFLFNNAILQANGTLGRKGFPETYDVAGMQGVLAAIRTGPADVPGYSHVIYDIDPGLTRRIEPADVILVEGLGLQGGAAASGLDLLIYLDADEADLEAWFTERFMAFWRAAEHDPTSFYARFRTMDEAQARGFAGVVWSTINLPNLRQHISQGRAAADLVVTKGADHQITSVNEVAR